MAPKTMPEWATVGATVYGREFNNGIRGGEATLRAGIITRVTAASIFVRFNTAAGAAAGEDRYTLQRWNDAPELHGHKSEHYTRILVSEEQGQHELAGIAKRRAQKAINGAAMRAAKDIGYTLNPTTARQAIEALQAYLDSVGE
jgi:hypothetical protein